MDRSGEELAEAALDPLGERRHRDERGVVVVLTVRRLALPLEDADDGERRLADAHGLPDRVRGASEQALHHRLSEEHDLRSGIDVGLREDAARRDRPAPDLEVLGRGPGDRGRPVQLVTDDRLVRAKLRRRRFHRRHLGPDRREVVPRERGHAAEAAERSARGRRAGHHDEEVRAHRREGLLHLRLRARADGHHRDDRGDADDDAERREERPHLVPQHRPECDEDRDEGVHDASLTDGLPRSKATPRARAAAPVSDR